MDHDYATLAGNYESEYSFDANGNLETLKRWADNSGTKTLIDNFTYNYTTGTNQLTHVDDALGASVLGDDLADQAADNYTYTEIGELLTDDQEEIAEIKWKVTGKVHKIIRESTSDKSNLEFVYDAMGNRILKIETDAGTDELIKKTYYIRDAQGNVMSIYTLDHLITPPEAPETLGLMLTERSIYGSSRIGTENPNELLARTDSTLSPSIDFVQTVGDKKYELSNHLGNVLQVVTDRKLGIDDGTGDIDYYIADVISQSDYYPFGMIMSGRNESADDYRYGFNGMEKDDEVSGSNNSYSAPYWQYDPRVGRRWNRDPVDHVNYSSYLAYSNNPILRIDPLGADDYFDMEGNFLYHTDTEVDEIRIVKFNSQQISEVMASNPDGYKEVFHASSDRIQDIPIPIGGEYEGITVADNQYSQIMGKISEHYMTEEQKKNINHIGIGEAEHAYSYDREGEVFFDASYQAGVLKLDEDFTVGKLKALLRHETDHILNPYEGDMHSLKYKKHHLDMFLRDIADPNFIDTPIGFQEHINNSIEAIFKQIEDHLNGEKLMDFKEFDKKELDNWLEERKKIYEDQSKKNEADQQSNN